MTKIGGGAVGSHGEAVRAPVQHEVRTTCEPELLAPRRSRLVKLAAATSSEPRVGQGPTGAHRGRPPVGEPVIERAFKLLDVFDAVDRPLSITSLSARSGIPKSTVCRLARTLVELGALERLPDGEFTIGLRLLELATLAPRGHGIRAKALPHMQELQAATATPVVLGVRDGTEAVLVERLSAGAAVRTQYRVGGRLPLHATALGLCLLAHAPVVIQEQILAGDLVVRPENIRLSAAHLRTRLFAVRREGVAIVSRSIPDHWTTVAGPVYGSDGQVAAAMAVIAPASSDVFTLRSAVLTTCQEASKVVAGQAGN